MSNYEQEPKDWITIKGNAIPIFEGQTKESVAKEFIKQKKENSKHSSIKQKKEQLDVNLNKLETFIKKNSPQTVKDFDNIVKEKQKKIDEIKAEIEEIANKSTEVTEEEIKSFLEKIDEKEKQAIKKATTMKDLLAEKLKEDEKLREKAKKEQQEKLQRLEKISGGNEDLKAQLNEIESRFKESSDMKEGGYTGYSMSNRATKAYTKGAVPISKLNKKEKEIAEKLGASEWHHSSKFYNKTNFYDKNLIGLINKGCSKDVFEYYIDLCNEYDTFNYDEHDLNKWLKIKDVGNSLYNSLYTIQSKRLELGNKY